MVEEKVPNKLNRARSEILEKAKKLGKKSDRCAFAVKVLHDYGLHSVDRKWSLELVRELGIPRHHSLLRNGLKIAKALNKLPESVEEVFEGAKKAGLGHLSESTLLDIANRAFGISEAGGIVWKDAMHQYAKVIEDALGRKPESVEEVFEGAKKAGLGHLNEMTILNVAYQGFKIHGAGEELSNTSALKRRVDDVYQYFKEGGKFSWTLPHGDDVIKLGIALYVKEHLLRHFDEDKIIKILTEKRKVPTQLARKVLNLAKELKEGEPA